MNTHPSDPSVEPGTIVVSATFTAEPLEKSLTFWMEELGIQARIVFAPYNQVFQQLLDPSSLLSTNRKGINAVLVRFEDWGRDELGPEGKRAGVHHCEQQIERNALDLTIALIAASERSSMFRLIILCPASVTEAAVPERVSFYKRMESLMASELDGVHGIHLVTAADLAATYPVGEYCDPHADKLSHVPYTPEFFTAVGTLIARKLYSLENSCYKVIVLDCDQTLWSGTCGEDGPFGIQIDPSRKAIQEFMVRQHDSGMLLCLCSKNNEEDVIEVFERRSEMVMKRDHVVAWRLNWRPKSENIKSLAQELNLGLDSIIFFDDDPVECAEVQANCPEVLTIQLPMDPSSAPRFLNHLWVLDRLKITDEGKTRTALYHQNKQREQLRKESPTLKDFHAGLGLKVQLSPVASHQLARVAELTQRTNQFNLTTIRRSDAEIQKLCQGGMAECLVVYVKDRFGDYGLVGVIIFTADSGVMSVDTFLLSCRALGRGVEHRMLAKLGEIARQRGLSRVDIPFIQSKKNQPALDFLQLVGDQFEEPSDQGILFRFPAESAAVVSYRPPGDDLASSLPSDGTISAFVTSNPIVSSRAKAALLSSIAAELHSVQQIHELISSQTRTRPELQTNFVAPHTSLEKELAKMCSELLGIKQVGIHDNFFDLGGHSLLATQVLSRMRQTFQVELSPRLLFTGQFTVAELAKAVNKQMIKQAGTEEIAVMLKKLSHLSNDEVNALLGAKSEQKPSAE